jgi:hypothetical protein
MPAPIGARQITYHHLSIDRIGWLAVARAVHFQATAPNTEPIHPIMSLTPKEGLGLNQKLDNTYTVFIQVGQRRRWNNPRCLCRPIDRKCRFHLPMSARRAVRDGREIQRISSAG